MTSTCFACDPPVACSTPAALRTHKSKFHGAGTEPATCEFCELVGTKTSIAQHQRTCDQQPALDCELCGKIGSFKNRRSLLKHQRSTKHVARATDSAKKPVFNIQLELPDQVKNAMEASMSAAPRSISTNDNSFNLSGFDLPLVRSVANPAGDASAANIDSGGSLFGPPLSRGADARGNGSFVPDDDGAPNGGDGSLGDVFSDGFGNVNNGNGNGDDDSDNEDVYERQQREAKRRRESVVSSVPRAPNQHVALQGHQRKVPMTVDVALDSRAFLDLLKSAVLHARHWRDMGTNVTNKQTTRTTRATSGKRLILRYIDWLKANNAVMLPVVSKEQLADINSHTYGLALADALHSSALTAAHNGSPSVWLKMEKDDDAYVAKWLQDLKLSKSTAHTALAMLRTMMRWLKHCVTEKQMARAVVREGLGAYLDGFAVAAEAPLKRLSAYKRATVRAATAKNAELWKTRTEEYARLLYSLYGELMHWLTADLAALVADKERGEIDDDVIARRSWSLVAVLLSGVGTFAVVSVSP